jgi:hypothetical protein
LARLLFLRQAFKAFASSCARVGLLAAVLTPKACWVGTRLPAPENAVLVGAAKLGGGGDPCLQDSSEPHELELDVGGTVHGDSLVHSCAS